MNIKSITNTGSVANTSNAKVNNDSKKSFQSFLGESKDLDAIFQKAADKYGVDVKLLKAIGKAESDFNPNSTSHCGAMGIMQLMPETAKGLGVTNAYDPEQCIMGGAKLISNLLKKYDGDVTLALAGYNAGTGNVRKYGGVPPFKETQNYIKKVLKYSGSAGNVKVNDTTASSQSTNNNTGAQQTAQTSQQANNHTVPQAGTRMIPSGYQLKRAAEEKANTQINEANTSVVSQAESNQDTIDAQTIRNKLSTSTRDQLTAYLNELEEKGKVTDVNDMFSYEDYLNFMNIFFKEEEKEDAATYGAKKNDVSAAQLQMSANIRSMLRNL